VDALLDGIVVVERLPLRSVLAIRPPPGEDLLVDLVGEEDLARDHLVAAKEYFEVHVRRAPAVPTGEDRSELHVAGRISELRTAQVVLPHRRFGRDAAD